MEMNSMRPDATRHPNEEQVERFSLGTLSERESSSFEEHLLICQSCQDRVAASDRFVAAMQDASLRIRHSGLHANRRWKFPVWTRNLTTATAVFCIGAVGV